MSNMTEQVVQPGEIKLNLIPCDWPLTPVSSNKNPYLPGWQNKPQTIEEIQIEIEKGDCKAVGLISGPCYNQPYGLVWVDVDGPTVYQTIEEEQGFSVEDALPKTLTILSGREGRERKLYKLSKENWKYFIRNKYCWHAEGYGEKLEILWKRHQGVLMGVHPQTDGYHTKEGEDFSCASMLPELPAWILSKIKMKNIKQGAPQEENIRTFGGNFAFTSKIGLERTMQEAVEAMWALNPEATDDYDVWITIGQSLHSVDDSLLEHWDEWSKQSDKYREGECQKRWRSFSKNGGIGAGTLFHHAKEAGWYPNQEHRVTNVGDEQLEMAEKDLENMIETMGNLLFNPPETPRQTRVKRVEAPQKEKKGTKNLSSDQVAHALLRMYEGNLLFDPASNNFLKYNHDRSTPGLWVSLDKSKMMSEIWSKCVELKSSCLPNGFDNAFVKQMYENLYFLLEDNDWEQDVNKILFQNGVFNLTTRELSEPRREEKITHALSFQYDPSNTCDQIKNWLSFTQFGDEDRVQLLRAWMRAVLTCSGHIQKFMEVVGPGKSGKSSFMKLCTALVGRESAAVSNLERLEKNRFGLSGIAGKKLLLFNDVERYGGNVTQLKAITGGDEVVAEHKFGGSENFIFKGLCMISANEQIATTDATSGLARRRLTVPFDRVFRGSAKEQTTLVEVLQNGHIIGKFAKELPGLVNWLLEMTTEEMESFLLETTERVKYFKEHSVKQLTRANPIIDWLNQNIIFVPQSRVMIGDAKPAGKDSLTFYANADRKLYANYAEFCRNNNVGAQARSRFEANLIDILQNQLNLNISKSNTRTVSLFNIKIRQYQVDDYHPSLVELALNPDNYTELYGNIQIRHH